VNVSIDHAHGKVTIAAPGEPESGARGTKHTITTNDSVTITITNTNSALFDVAVTSERPENETVGAEKKFLEMSKPYLIDLGSAALNAVGSVIKKQRGEETYSISDSIDTLRQRLSQGVLPRAISVSLSLQRLNDLLFNAPFSVRVLELKAMEELRRLDPTNRTQFTLERERFRDMLLKSRAFPDTTFGRYIAPDSLLSCWAQLNTSLGALALHTASAEDLQQTLIYTLRASDSTSVKARLKPGASSIDSFRQAVKQNDPLLAYANKLISEAGRALDEKDANLRTAAAVELISRQTAQASCEARLCVVRPESGKDQIVHIKISQSEAARLADFPAQSEEEYVFTIQPERPFRAELAFGLVGWIGSTFGDYVAVQLGSSQYQITRRPPDFTRFRFVATLSILLQKPEWIFKNNSKLWFPEITVGPANDIEALGLGAAYQIGSVKIGLGGLWIKHVELAGQIENQIIPSASALRTTKDYGRFWHDPRLYISLTISDIPPFIAPK
jgi:hypothetical protein